MVTIPLPVKASVHLGAPGRAPYPPQVPRRNLRTEGAGGSVVPVPRTKDGEHHHEGKRMDTTACHEEVITKKDGTVIRSWRRCADTRCPQK